MTFASSNWTGEGPADLGRRQYQTLDGLRGVAALSVVVLHTPHFFAKWHLPFSFLAVDLFFVLSGFVLSAAYGTRLRCGMTVAGFARIRLIRLYPLFFLGTLLGIPVALLAMKYGEISVEWSAQFFIISLPLSLAMLPTPTAGSDGFVYPFNPVLWTIFFELVVNVLYALLAKQLSDMRILILLVVTSGAALAAYVLRIDNLDCGGIWSTFVGGLARMMFSFFCGVLVFRIRRPGKIHSSALALGLLLMLICALAAPHTTLSATATVLLLFPAIVLLGASIEPGPALQRAFALLGTTSYAVYALHKPVYQILLGFLIVASPVKVEAMTPWIGLAFLCLLLAGCVAIDQFFDAPTRQFLGQLRIRRRREKPDPIN